MKRGDLQSLVATLGQPATFRQTKPPQAVVAIAKTLTQSTSRSTEPVVQQYGVNGREFVFMSDVLGFEPERFDRIEIGGERYALDVVIPLHEEGTGYLMAYRTFSKGK